MNRKPHGDLAWLALLVAVPAMLAQTGCGGAQGSGPTQPTFYRDVAPIVFDHCATCHRPNGSAPFSLLTYEGVRDHAPQIVKVTQSGYMPPWLPTAGAYPLRGDCRLSASQIKTIQDWVSAECMAGNRQDAPPMPAFRDGWVLGEPDLVVQMPATYQLPAEGADVWRQFLIPVPITTAKYVRAVEILPSNAKVVHHAVVHLDSSGAARKKAAESPDGGFDVQTVKEQRHPPGHTLNWLPGLVPFAEDPDMAWQLNPGTDLIVEAHLIPSGKPEPIRISVGLYFTDKPPTRFPVTLLLHNDTIDIPAGEPAYEASDTYRLPMDVRVLGVLPHAHLLGKQFDLDAALPNGDTLSLLHIPKWDFNWQNAYRYVEPVPLPAGTTLRMRIRYDNSAQNVRNPNSPPQRVQYGFRTSEEMGQATVQVLPRSESEANSRSLLADFQEQEHYAMIDSYQLRLEQHPDDVSTRVELAKLLVLTKRREQGLQELRRALEIDPNHAEAHYYLGRFGFAPQADGARLEFEAAAKANPQHYQALGELGLWHLNRNNLAKAEQLLESSLAAHPDDAVVLNNLGIVRFKQQNLPEAVRQFRAALKVDPGYAPARDNLRKLEPLLKQQ